LLRERLDPLARTAVCAEHDEPRAARRLAERSLEAAARECRKTRRREVARRLRCPRSVACASALPVHAVNRPCRSRPIVVARGDSPASADAFFRTAEWDRTARWRAASAGSSAERRGMRRSRNRSIRLARETPT
jgi:hypothetical protein